MKTYPVRLDPQAKVDIEEVGDWLTRQSSAKAAESFIGRIREACERIGLTPQQGRRFDQVYPGLRVAGFERRSSICFTFDGEEVIILRFLYAGRDLAKAFAHR